MTRKVKLVTPIRLEPKYLENSWRYYFATIANYYLPICHEAVRSAILATAWILVSISHTNTGQLFGTQGTGWQNVESKFSHFSEGNNRTHLCGRGLPHSAHIPSTTFNLLLSALGEAQLTQAPQCWEGHIDHSAPSEVMGPHSCHTQ